MSLDRDPPLPTWPINVGLSFRSNSVPQAGHSGLSLWGWLRAKVAVPWETGSSHPRDALNGVRSGNLGGRWDFQRKTPMISCPDALGIISI